MTAAHATTVDFSLAVHAWGAAWQPVLFAPIQPESSIAGHWRLHEDCFSLSPRHLLRLHCALLI
jgi:hypothetical protein